MTAIIVKAPGGLDLLERRELPDPGPSGPGAIRVRLHANPLNFHDYGVVSTPNRVSDGRIPMSNGAGVIEAVGEGVTEFEVGDHVVSCFFPTWKEGAPAVGDFSTVPGDGVDGYAREIGGKLVGGGYNKARKLGRRQADVGCFVSFGTGPKRRFENALNGSRRSTP